VRRRRVAIALVFLFLVAGLAWLAGGFAYGAWKTRWFRQRIEFSVPDDEGEAR